MATFAELVSRLVASTPGATSHLVTEALLYAQETLNHDLRVPSVQAEEFYYLENSNDAYLTLPDDCLELDRVDWYIPDEDLISDGGFDTGTDWTAGTGWTISGGQASFTGATAGNLSQDISLSAIEYLMLTFDATITSGSVTPYLNSTAGEAVTESGSVVQVFAPTSLEVTLSFTAAASSSLAIDDVSLRSLVRTTTINPTLAYDKDKLWITSGGIPALARVSYWAKITPADGTNVASNVFTENYSELLLALARSYLAVLRGDSQAAALLKTDYVKMVQGYNLAHWNSRTVGKRRKPSPYLV